MKKQTYTEKINDPQNTEIHLFAAANTFNGFVSFFDKTFCRNGVTKIYILKGGPGSGKSTVMKKYAEAAVKKGQTPIYYHCSSDPDSLDGVTVKETGVSILDGTAPHVFDPVYPGVRDFYINLSGAWDLSALEKNSEKIKSLADSKASCYKTAYRLLAAVSSVTNQMCESACEFVDKEKISGFVRRFSNKYIKNKGEKTGKISEVVTSAISAKGFVRYFTLEKAADTVFFVKDTCFASRFLMDELVTAVKKSGVNAVFALSPENPEKVCGILLPDSRICISGYDENMEKALEASGKTVKTVNSSRFINTERYKVCRQKFRFAEKCRKTLLDAAIGELSGAGAFHSEIESVYIAATDYSKVTEIAKAID